MKILSIDQMALLEGGRFWGWEPSGASEVNWSDPNCGGGPSTTYELIHYVFWIPDAVTTSTECWEAPQ